MARLKVETLGEAPLGARRLVRLCAKRVFAYFAYPFEAEVCVRFVTPAEIRGLNAKYRGKDKETDVLSFPELDFYRGEGKISDADKDPATKRVFLGDTVISLSRAREQAREFGHGTARECAYLTVHSMLHLLGFDHEDEGEEKKAMREKEEDILKSLGLERK